METEREKLFELFWSDFDPKFRYDWQVKLFVKSLWTVLYQSRFRQMVVDLPRAENGS